MTRTVLAGDFRTGRRITQIPVRDAPWAVPHRGIGTIEAQIPLVADEFRDLEQTLQGLFPGPDVWPSETTWPAPVHGLWRPGQGLRRGFLAAIEPARCFLAVMDGDHVIEAGPIWDHDFDWATNILTVKAGGARSIFNHRFVMGVLAPDQDPAEWEVQRGGISLGTHAKWLIQLLMAHTGGDLPLVLPDDEVIPDGGHSRTYYGYELSNGGEKLDALMDVVNGPDIALEPHLTADRMGLEWHLRTGTVADPMLHQAGPDHVWDASAVRGPVSGLSVHRTATELAQRAWGTGAGMEKSLLMTSSEDPTFIDAGYPLMEIAENREGVDDPDTLQEWSDGLLSRAQRPWMTWSTTVRDHPVDDDGAPAGPQLGTYRTGDFAKVWVPSDHPYLSLYVRKGFHRTRIFEMSGGLAGDVGITFAPQMEVR